jgi:hypothetical protein
MFMHMFTPSTRRDSLRAASPTRSTTTRHLFALPVTFRMHTVFPLVTTSSFLPYATKVLAALCWQRRARITLDVKMT